MDEMQNNTPAWSWPERSSAGKTSPTQSGDSAHPADHQCHHESQPQSQSQPLDADLSASRAFRIRSTMLALTSTLLSALASFGVGLDEAQSAAVISVVSAVVAVVVLFRDGRDG